jgi:beta-mannosidase
LLQNDIWQAQSWSSIEYGGRWKLLHYSAKNFFAPLLVSAFQESNNITVYVSSDMMSAIKGELEVDVWTWKVREGSLIVAHVSVVSVTIFACLV